MDFLLDYSSEILFALILVMMFVQFLRNNVLTNKNTIDGEKLLEKWLEIRRLR